MMDLTAVLNPEPSKRSTPGPEDGEPPPVDEIVDAEPFIHIKEVDDSKDTRKESERYACYVKGCDNNKGKYFTRPRSVLEHIQKFHPTITWDRGKCARYEKDPGDPTRYNLKISTRGQYNRKQQPASHDTEADPDNEPASDPIPEPEQPALPEDAAPALKPINNEAHSPTPPTSTKPVAKKRGPKKGTNKGTKKASNSRKNTSSTSTKDEASATPTPSVSETPVTARISASLAKKETSMSLASSPTVHEQFEDNMSGSATDYDEEASGDEDAVYCICRKGDNHTWMVSCDGGCDEWFHGDCVGIPTNNHDVIDKFICPNCEKEGKGRTTYKPHCSFINCYRAAKYPSKYCSDTCGKERIAWAMSLSDPIWAFENSRYHYCISAGGKSLPKSYLKRNGLTQHPIDLSVSNAATKEIIVCSAAKASDAETASDDERDTPLSLPASDHDEGSDLSSEEDLPTRGGALRATEVKTLFSHVGTDLRKFKELGNDADNRLLSRIRNQHQLSHLIGTMTLQPDEITLFDRRLEFLEKVKARAAGMAVCGYDKRLALSMEAFAEALATGRIKLGEEDRVDGVDGIVNGEGEEGMVCQGRKRCGKHVNWAKVAQNDVRFERELARKGGGRRF